MSHEIIEKEFGKLPKNTQDTFKPVQLAKP